MTVRQPRYSKEDFAQRGDAIYESQIRLQVEEVDPLPRLKARGIQDSGRDCKLSLSDIP